MSLVETYAKTLAALCGNDFQAEVCARLQGVILSFQTVPAKPHGDAGLDGFSHGGERGYCCYGPEHSEFTTNKQREAAIVTKFKADLRSLFELTFEKKKLALTTSLEMETILPVGQRITHIELIVNWFESHRVLGPIFTAVAEYKAASACRFVDPSASVVIVGPRELADRYPVDEMAIFRSSQRIFVQGVRAAAQEVTIDDPKGFESKMATLREIRPDQIPAIRVLANQFRANWRMAIAFDNELDETLPALHRVLEDSRSQILARVAELMLASTEPWQQLPRAGEIAREVLTHGFGTQFGDLVPDVASGEIARLIGECPIGWEARRISNGR